MPVASCQCWLPACDYDLAATLTSGQAFRWQPQDDGWTGVVAGRWVQLTSRPDGILARTATLQTDWRWLADYLRVEENLAAVLESFPDDEPMRAAVAACRGLRLLRQEPWECLASFILSSTKQIVQIQQIVALVCECFGEPLPVPEGVALAFAFPSPQRLAAVTEADLRACKMGFRAPYLLATARRVASTALDLAGLSSLSLESARAELMSCPGVGRKIADCVLLFAGGFPQAFPVDVWIMKALQQLYFSRRRASRRRLEKFTATHFGPHAGYAQQYLFHYMRTKQSASSPKS
ncbi:MAG: DNA-3-methyladenine glycosylase 2 family protein [Verrucomicrobia bacterium]|nr:DNA-3-methyladenine glycosylase 2 family protein [Verrucomicrobiota bacterium]